MILTELYLDLLETLSAIARDKKLPVQMNAGDMLEVLQEVRALKARIATLEGVLGSDYVAV